MTSLFLLMIFVYRMLYITLVFAKLISLLILYWNSCTRIQFTKLSKIIMFTVQFYARRLNFYKYSTSYYNASINHV